MSLIFNNLIARKQELNSIFASTLIYNTLIIVRNNRYILYSGLICKFGAFDYAFVMCLDFLPRYHEQI
jgi:hypothetical protein